MLSMLRSKGSSPSVMRQLPSLRNWQRKKMNIGEIESIEAKESMFGKKVTLFKEDYDKLSDTAKKYVAMEKNIKKLKKRA